MKRPKKKIVVIELTTYDDTNEAVRDEVKGLVDNLYEVQQVVVFESQPPKPKRKK